MQFIIYLGQIFTSERKPTSTESLTETLPYNTNLGDFTTYISPVSSTTPRILTRKDELKQNLHDKKKKLSKMINTNLFECIINILRPYYPVNTGMPV